VGGGTTIRRNGGVHMVELGGTVVRRNGGEIVWNILIGVTLSNLGGTII
jgi:hypothetical protein